MRSGMPLSQRQTVAVAIAAMSIFTSSLALAGIAAASGSTARPVARGTSRSSP